MKPRNVRDAQCVDDFDALSKMGKAGAQVTARKRKKRMLREQRSVEVREIYADRSRRLTAKEERERAESAGEHICPIE